MPIESLILERFRGVRLGRIEDLTDVNILVGRNNCGKTTVAEAILRIAHFASSRARDAANRDRLTLCAKRRNELPLPFPDELWHGARRSGTFAFTARVDGGLVHHAYLGGAGNEPNQRAGEGTTFHHGATWFSPLDAWDSGLEKSLWREVLRDRADRRLAESLNEIFGFEADGVQLPPDGKLTLLLPDRGIPVDIMGDGTRAALRCLLLLAALRATALIIEEPESHQHPESLQKFAVAVCKLAAAQSVQLLITTHSRECVRAFAAAAETARRTPTVFHLSIDDGDLRARRLDAAALESLNASDTDVRSLDVYE